MRELFFNPGCALSMYKPDAAQRLLRLLNESVGPVKLHEVCCHYSPRLAAGSRIINVCPGCDRRFRSLYEGIDTISLWEVLDGVEGLQLPDYRGLRLSVHDACPVRERSQVHRAVRSLLKKMNIEVVEAPLHGAHSVCCGDVFYPKLPVEQVHRQMKKRADSMPCEQVCVICVSCVQSMHIGCKTPRHLVDLLLNEPTVPMGKDTARYHEQVRAYREAHQ